MGDKLPLEFKVIEELTNSNLLTLEMLEDFESRIGEHKTRFVEDNSTEEAVVRLLDKVHHLKEQLRWTRWTIESLKGTGTSAVLDSADTGAQQ
jgi:hypothetical protein